MKSIKMFGKSVPLLAIVLACMLTIGASAYLIDYLSDTVTSTVTVTSPMRVGISTGEGTDWATAQRFRPGNRENEPYEPYGMLDAFPEGLMSDGVTYEGFNTSAWTYEDWTMTGILEIPDIMGGETITLYFMSENLADAHIEAHEEIRVSNPGGVTRNDFELITTRFDPIYSDNGYGKLHDDNLDPPDAWRVDDNCIEFWPADDTSNWGSGETDVARWQITFNDAAFGTYTFSYRITRAP